MTAIDILRQYGHLSQREKALLIDCLKHINYAMDSMIEGHEYLLDKHGEKDNMNAATTETHDDVFENRLLDMATAVSRFMPVDDRESFIEYIKEGIDKSVTVDIDENYSRTISMINEIKDYTIDIFASVIERHLRKLIDYIEHAK